MNILNLFKKKQASATYTYSETDIHSHTKTTTTVLGKNKLISVHSDMDDFMQKFYDLSNIIGSSHSSIEEKLDACEKSYPMLKEFCRFQKDDLSFLPPTINCRDIGPELYMRLGRWNDAERTINLCVEANAYYPNNGDEVLKDFYRYKDVATKILHFLSANPGFPQNKIYKEFNFPNEDREHLKHFLRCSLQIRKEKIGNTNKLYLNVTPENIGDA